MKILTVMALVLTLGGCSKTPVKPAATPVVDMAATTTAPTDSGPKDNGPVISEPAPAK